MPGKNIFHDDSPKKEKEKIKLDEFELKISEIITEITSRNVNVEFNQDDPFSRKVPPKVSLKYFFGRIKKYCKIEKSTLILILIYADRMCTTSGIILNPHNIHRIILGCLILAIKYNEDIYYTNEQYAKIGGVSTQELNQLESYSFELLDFNLYISEEIYKKYLLYITNYTPEKDKN